MFKPQPRPQCVNTGCEKPVAWSGRRWRPHCSRCHQANYGANTLAPGVTSFKTGICSNQDAHMGWQCPIDYERSPEFKGVTHVDHIDGNYLNNTKDNVAERCPMCHDRKSRLMGDYKLQGKYA